ncbi:hypothetical protein V9T40_013297 [Parthenolecanium corni]|uniref:Dynamin-type G domain-containing protein n=1 Tax=Parthenolecanium corni TaxID=536013 RepID=A0AAN9TJM7_9HEMI
MSVGASYIFKLLLIGAIIGTFLTASAATGNARRMPKNNGPRLGSAPIMLKFGSEVGYHRDTNHRAAFQASDLIWWGVIRTQSKFQTFAKKLFVRGLSKIRAGTEVNSFSHSSKWRRTSEARPLVHTRNGFTMGLTLGVKQFDEILVGKPILRQFDVAENGGSENESNDNELWGKALPHVAPSENECRPYIEKAIKKLTTDGATDDSINDNDDNSTDKNEDERTSAASYDEDVSDNSTDSPYQQNEAPETRTEEDPEIPVAEVSEITDEGEEIVVQSDDVDAEDKDLGTTDETSTEDVNDDNSSEAKDTTKPNAEPLVTRFKDDDLSTDNDDSKENPSSDDGDDTPSKEPGDIKVEIENKDTSDEVVEKNNTPNSESGHDDAEQEDRDEKTNDSNNTKKNTKTTNNKDDDDSENENEDEDDQDDDDDDDDSIPEEELIKHREIPKKLRNKEHISTILQLDEEEHSDSEKLKKVTEVTLKELKKLYDSAIKPMEVLYKYRDLSNRHFGDPEIFSKPLVLFMGPWSGGKSTIINYLLDNEYSDTALRSGAEPSPAYFNILMHGENDTILDGTQLAADWTFSGLQKFGQGLLDRLKGHQLSRPLLEKVNIVEIPGILEIRKQVERVFPFNDACQWFIDRADIIFLIYDPSKLDVGPETEAILDQLKGREYQTRIILNKADQVRAEELMRVQGTLIWNISPLMSSVEPPVMYSTSLWSLPYEKGAPVKLLKAQEIAFLRDLRAAIEKRVENKIACARRFAVRVRNHAKMVDCYLTTYYNHKSFFGNRKKISEDIIEHPQNYHIYEGLSTLTNISRYDLPDPEVYRDFFRLHPVYEFQKLSETCTYFRGCPINKLDIAIAYDLPELVGKYRKSVETILSGGTINTKNSTK